MNAPNWSEPPFWERLFRRLLRGTSPERPPTWGLVVNLAAIGIGVAFALWNLTVGEGSPWAIVFGIVAIVGGLFGVAVWMTQRRRYVASMEGRAKLGPTAALGLGWVYHLLVSSGAIGVIAGGAGLVMRSGGDPIADASNELMEIWSLEESWWEEHGTYTRDKQALRYQPVTTVRVRIDTADVNSFTASAQSTTATGALCTINHSRGARRPTPSC